MEEIDPSFKQKVCDIVAAIPKGKVMSYGQIASLAGSPQAAKIVGGIAHQGDPSLPWQRVVKADGSLAAGYPGGISGHQSALEDEGVEIDETGRVNMKELRWHPPISGQSSLL